MQISSEHEGYIPFLGYRIWYRVLGDLDHASEPVPVVLLHGGPGLSHRTLLPLAELASTGRPVVFYDQLGSGRSDHPDDPSLFDVDLFLDQLATLRQALDLEAIHLFGHSWGGQLAMEYALTRPAGLRSLILHSSGAVATLAFATRQQALAELSPAARDALVRLEAAGTFTGPEYQAAAQVFHQRFTCRLKPWPAWLAQDSEEMNVALNIHMYESDLPRTGPLRDWDIRPRLRNIAVPTLITAGRHDGGAGGQERLLHAGISGAELVMFEDSAHYAHAEEPERYLIVINDFLTRVEQRQPGRPPARG